MNNNNLDLKVLDTEIKNLKETLYLLMAYNDLTNKAVVECSQKLDELILQYQTYEKLL
ncbi:aspartyl-phosphate phosphatase Spo0E family protein [Clostridium sp. DJ247]|uniref:aspartyl-phosphate phosphatase Spo0E family protein n=1 Tax=Clostridium sp. DJ247 TaxID=2726188 RepID=UPI00162761D8|nr:aspartyl-phosphate phosphatase Spo0E family protein [Clostridium sp. DJ247]MBC2581906.1 aspartyl-phosphate phosphatase Spo0E family protein [Clostridium sp. DJ247]